MASPGNLSEMQILWPHPGPPKSEVTGVGPIAVYVPPSRPGGADTHAGVRTTVQRNKKVARTARLQDVQDPPKW